MAINPNLLRLFSNGESFLDNDGKPLVGNVSFYDRDNPGRTCLIYDKDGTTIQNPMPTTSTGRLEKDVYLENNKAYLIEFAKYIPELSAYLFQYSVELPKNIFVFQYDDELSSSVVTYFDNVDQMTNEIGPFVDGKIYGLKGYYTAGDKDIVYYRCEAYTGENDGGSTFTVNSAEDEQQHTLRIIPPAEKYFDVRHFGIFPSNSEYINLSQLSNCDNYCYTNGYIMSFVPSGSYAIYFIQNANLNLLSTIFGTSETVIDFTNSTSTLKLDDCLIKINASAGCSITLNGTTIHQSNIGTDAESYITPVPTINYIVDQYSASTISAKDVNFIILANTTDNVYNIENCKIYSNAKINLAKQNTIKYCYIRQSFFYNLTEANIKQQTLLGNTTNKSDWSVSYYWIAFLIVGKQQEIDLQGSVGLGGYTLDIDVDTVIKNGSLSNGTITFSQGLFTMENVTCSSSATIKTYTTVKTTSNNYNAIITGCTFETGNKSQFICRTLKATNCDFMSAGTGTPYGFNIDCEYVNAVNCNFYCDVFTCSYIASTKYTSYFSNNNFHSNLYIRPGTATSSAYISADWGTSYNMWNYGCTIMNNNFYEAADNAGHIRIFQITWDNQTVGNQAGYITELLQINDNIIISNIKQTPLDTERKWNWIQWPERPDPNNPATGVLYQFTGAYSYKNNKGDFSFKYKIFKYCKTRRYEEYLESDYKVNELICAKNVRSDKANAWLWKSPLYPFIFSFGENKSKRIIKYKVTMDSWYCDISNLDNATWAYGHEHVLYNSDFERYIWNTYDSTPNQIHYIKGVGDINYKYAPPFMIYEGELVNNVIGAEHKGEGISIVTYNREDGFPDTWSHQPDANCYHNVILTVEEL
jgi:hypothetical protein